MRHISRLLPDSWRIPRDGGYRHKANNLVFPHPQNYEYSTRPGSAQHMPKRVTIKWIKLSRKYPNSDENNHANRDQLGDTQSVEITSAPIGGADLCVFSIEPSDPSRSTAPDTKCHPPVGAAPRCEMPGNR